MNMAELQKQLFAAARANPPSDDVPYAFEERILAQLAAKPAFDILAAWNRTLWQAAAPCVAVAISFGVWNAFAPGSTAASSDLSLDLEQTVLASVTLDSETVQ